MATKAHVIRDRTASLSFTLDARSTFYSDSFRRWGHFTFEAPDPLSRRPCPSLLILLPLFTNENPSFRTKPQTPEYY